MMETMEQTKRKAAVTYNYDSYNQAISYEVCQVLKAVQGGDDVPRVLIVYEIENINREEIFEWHEDEVSVTLRNKGGSYGGGQKC